MKPTTIFLVSRKRQRTVPLFCCHERQVFDEQKVLSSLNCSEQRMSYRIFSCITCTRYTGNFEAKVGVRLFRCPTWPHGTTFLVWQGRWPYGNARKCSFSFSVFSAVCCSGCGLYAGAGCMRRNAEVPWTQCNHDWSDYGLVAFVRCKMGQTSCETWRQKHRDPGQLISLVAIIFTTCTFFRTL